MNGSKQIDFLWQVVVPGISSALLTFAFLTLIVRPVEIRGADPYYTLAGCRYDPDSIEPISYRFFSVGSDYETAFKDAEDEWDDTTAPKNVPPVLTRRSTLLTTMSRRIGGDESMGTVISIRVHLRLIQL